MQIIEPSFSFPSPSLTLILIQLHSYFILFFFSASKKQSLMKMMTMREEHRFHKPLSVTATSLILNYRIVVDDEI